MPDYFRPQLSEVAANHLIVARTCTDPVLVRRALKELERWKAEPEVKEFFANFERDARRKAEKEDAAAAKRVARNWK
jgi:hypothetical protein